MIGTSLTPRGADARSRHAPAILAEGRNCWRRPHANRVAFLIDGAAYFAAFAAAVARARHSILILGWDIDSRLRLHPAESTDLPEQLAAFLAAVLRQRRSLHAYVLDWDFAMIYAFEREALPTFKPGWRRHRRLHFRLDSSHPSGACHHQKVVVIDDSIAFAGGLDLTARRWDTPEHRADDDRRIDPWQKSYAPFHDVQVAVDGPAAAALGDLARERWYRATGQRLHAPHVGSDPWPSHLTPDLNDVPVAIARTEPAFAERPEVREVEALYLDSIAAARDCLYIENQYLTSSRVGDALAARLQEADGPEVVVVAPHQCSGWLERSTMGVLRARLLHRLSAADRFGRFRIYYPTVPNLDGTGVNVHSKVMIVDDTLVRIGSSNLSNRSMGLDTECDVAIEANGEARVEAAITELRNRLVGEHLGVSPARVAAVTATAGSLTRAVDSLRGSGRTLMPLEDRVPEWADGLVPDIAILDPERPVDADRFMAHFVTDDVCETAHHRFWGAAVLIVLIVGLALAWRLTPLREMLDPNAVMRWTGTWSQHWLAPLIVTGGYVLASLAIVPLNLLIIGTGLVFGEPLGFVYALLGSIVSAVITYAIGRMLLRDTVRRLAGARLNRLSRRLAKRGISAVVLSRMLPLAPFTIVNLVAGASHLRFRDYVIGTAIGLVPGVAVLTLLGGRVSAALRHPGPFSFAALGGLVLLLLIGSYWLRRRLERMRPDAAS